VIERIAEAKKADVERLLRSFSIDGIKPRKNPFNPYDFFAETSGKVAVIAEIKKASPVKGMLCQGIDAGKMAGIYASNGAWMVSVITESRFFEGEPEYLQEARKSIELPILRKDFIIHEIQLYESLELGADLVLLIAVLSDYGKLLYMCEKSRELGLEPLVEVHSAEEAKMTLDLPARMIGINNRNLKDFTVDIRNSLELGDLIPDSVVKVSESGIAKAEDMFLLEQNGFNAALVGEALVTAPDPGKKLRELVYYRGDGML